MLVNGSFRTICRNFGGIWKAKKEVERRGAVLLQTDISGTFAVLPNDLFHEKVQETMQKLFKIHETDVEQVKKQIVAILCDCEFQREAKAVGNIKDCHCMKMFLVKDHKVDFPLRVVLNENQSWQKLVSVFLQKGFQNLKLEKSLALTNSEDLLKKLCKFHKKECFLVSLDIKDLSYSLIKDVLLVKLRELLQEDLVGFQLGAGISVEDFLKLIDLYLSVNVVQHNEGLWTQKEGIFIGSSTAPALAEGDLNSLDSVAVDMMQTRKSGTLWVGRYVDDIIICTTKGNEISVIKQYLMASCP